MKVTPLEEYRKFCAPSELHKAIQMLRGIIAGISYDQNISDAEMLELSNWVTLHENLRDYHPFQELIPAVEKAVEDDVITEEEREDILWICSRFSKDGDYYDLVTSSIQFLHGLAHGLLADGELLDSEIQALRNWLNQNAYLRGVYPYDELNSLICAALADRVIDQSERQMLKAFLSTMIEFKDSRNLAEADFSELRKRYSTQGICAVCPEIEFAGKVFCLTGESYKASREDFIALIEACGGVVRTKVSSKTDYLIVGDAGNPCWAFACYGRKIEQAIELRKNGAKVIIVNETDFWDAVADT